MADPVITIRNLGKQYRLGATVSPNTLRDQLVERIASMASALRRSAQSTHGHCEAEQFWAIRDIDLDIREGDVLGIVGRNGAGKSTLLKVLGRITEPTTGEVRIRGRVGSLLEVGTGFHPELTGRENIYLNGSILGMPRQRIRRKLDEIVAFAGVEQFLDTPVKRYSSGMSVRLAFAVAAHLEPEILLIDEVLAVGDTEFQQRCLIKMNDVAQAGRTVLFVSHNLAAVEALCSRAILLDHGRIEVDGSTHDVLGRYQKDVSSIAGGRAELAHSRGRTSASVAAMTRVTLSCGDGEPTSAFRTHDDLCIDVEFDRPDRDFSPVLGFVIRNQLKVPLMSLDNRIVPGFRFAPMRDGMIRCRVPGLPLTPGWYGIDLYLGDLNRSFDTILDAVSFSIIESDVYGSGKMPYSHLGNLSWRASWEIPARAADASHQRTANSSNS